LPPRIHCGQSALGRMRHHTFPLVQEHGARKNEEPPHLRLLHRRVRVLPIVRLPRLQESQLESERPSRDFGLLHHVSNRAFRKHAWLPEDGNSVRPRHEGGGGGGGGWGGGGGGGCGVGVGGGWV